MKYLVSLSEYIEVEERDLDTAFDMRPYETEDELMRAIAETAGRTLVRQLTKGIPIMMKIKEKDSNSREIWIETT